MGWQLLAGVMAGFRLIGSLVRRVALPVLGNQDRLREIDERLDDPDLTRDEEADLEDEEDERTDLVNTGCGCLFATLVVGLLGWATVLGVGFLTSDSVSSDSASPGPGTDPDRSASNETRDPAIRGSQYVFSADGLLIPIGGDWEVANQEGVYTCDVTVQLEEHRQKAFLEVLEDGEQIRITSYDDGGVFVLDRIEASETEATYFVDLSEDAGMDFQMTMVFTSSTTLGGQLSGCPDRGGQGYLLEERDEPSESSAARGGSSTGLLESCVVTPEPGLSESELDSLVDCFTPLTGAFIVEALPDVEGVYYITEGFTQGHGGDPLDWQQGVCSLSDGLFLTDSTTDSAQVWLGVPDEGNPMMGVLRFGDNGPSHHYLPLYDSGPADVQTRHMPSENPWAGWTVFEAEMFNEALFFPWTQVTFPGDPTYEGRITLVCG